MQRLQEDVPIESAELSTRELLFVPEQLQELAAKVDKAETAKALVGKHDRGRAGGLVRQAAFEPKGKQAEVR